MLPWEEGYWLVRFLLQRGLAAIYLCAFLVAATQFRPLAGENGLFSLRSYAERASVTDGPSLFQFFPSDRAVALAAWAGVGLSLVALLAGPYFLPPDLAVPASMGLWFLLWGLCQSFVNAGGLFYGYGWESMLLETGFLAVFLGAGPTGPPVLIVWLFSWLLFRNMFGAGLIKMRGDRCWRDLTAMDFHYETQPMPNPGSWFAHHLSERFHRLEVVGNHVVELAVPFLYFAPEPYASVAGVLTVGFQGWLMLTGNFSWLNALTIVQAIAVTSDRTLAAVLPVSAPAAAPAPLYLQVLAAGVTLLVLALSYYPVTNMLSPNQRMNAGFDPFHIVNTYGAFGSITKERYGLVVEGTNQEHPEEGDWAAYSFKGHPDDPSKRPRQWAPYHLRLDWQLWFAAMRPRPGRRQQWVFTLLERLLDGDSSVEGLLADVPFDDGPEKVRVLRYRYRFTTPEERAESGDWWVRERVGAYVPATSNPGPGPFGGELR